MIELFDIQDINKSPATFDMGKMLWVNQQYIMRADLSILGREMARRLNQRGIGLGFRTRYQNRCGRDEGSGANS